MAVSGSVERQYCPRGVPVATRAPFLVRRLVLPPRASECLGAETIGCAVWIASITLMLYTRQQQPQPPHTSSWGVVRRDTVRARCHHRGAARWRSARVCAAARVHSAARFE